MQTYLIQTIHSVLKLKKDVICLHSWLPLNKNTELENVIFNPNRSCKTSIENDPRST